MVRRLIYIGILFTMAFTCLRVEAQEFPWSLNYITNMNTINPAYVGMWGRAGFLSATQTNWYGTKGAPLIRYFSYYTPVNDQKNGIGVNIQRRNVGFEKILSLTGDYSYQVRLDVYNYLRLGFRAGIVNYDNNLKDYQLYPDRIPDREFTTDVRQYFMTTFGIGAILFDDRYYVSLSIPQVIDNTFRVNQNGISSLHELKTVYLSGGYVVTRPGAIMLRPNLLVMKALGRRLCFDASALVFLPGDLLFGLTIRSNKAICLSGQYTFKNGVRIGYGSMHHFVHDIQKPQMAACEVIVGYDFNLYRKKNTKPCYF